MSKEILKKSFYLTSLFADVKSEHNWSVNEIKTVMILFSKMNEYRVYIPDFETVDDIYKELKKVPTVYDITIEEFMNITGVSKSNVSREINKTRKKLGSKIINTPHPFEENEESGATIPWFSQILYSKDKSKLTLHLNTIALERLSAFVKYSKICFSNITNLRSNYSVYIYLLIKIIKDISYNNDSTYEYISISELKSKLSLGDKYTNIADFKKYVLDVVLQEINDYTDLIFSYELIKEGRAYKNIKFIFDYKPELRENNKPKKIITTKQLPQISEKSELDLYMDDSSPFEKTLVSWGVKAKKVVELESVYSLETIALSIDETFTAETDGKIKNTKAAFFLGVLENKQKSEDEIFQRQTREFKQKEDDDLRCSHTTEKEKQYNSIQQNINLYEDELSKYLSAKSMSITYQLPNDINNFIETLPNINKEVFKGYKPKFAVLDKGYFDMNFKKEIRPNMYDFLMLLAKYE